MTHKDYVKIAGALAEARADWQNQDLASRAALAQATRRIADVLQADNERFDRERFYAAARGKPITGRDRP